MKQTQLLKGSLDLAVVAALATGESYGYEILERLADLGDVGDASVYGTLRRLEESGLLVSHLVAGTGGAARRYYAVTAAGRAWLEEAAVAWRGLARTIDRLLEEVVT